MRVKLKEGLEKNEASPTLAAKRDVFFDPFCRIYLCSRHIHIISEASNSVESSLLSMR